MLSAEDEARLAEHTDALVEEVAAASPVQAGAISGIDSILHALHRRAVRLARAALLLANAGYAAEATIVARSLSELSLDVGYMRLKGDQRPAYLLRWLHESRDDQRRVLKHMPDAARSEEALRERDRRLKALKRDLGIKGELPVFPGADTMARELGRDRDHWMHIYAHHLTHGGELSLLSIGSGRGRLLAGNQSHAGHGSLGEAADEWQRSYRRDIWRTNWATCEMWSGSRGLLATINDVAGEYGTITLGVGGFASASVGWETAQDVRRSTDLGPAFYIYFLGDWDPSGRAIGDTAERDIRVHLTDAENELFAFERVALTPDLIARHKLPTAPVKRNRDGTIKGNHARDWDGGTVELDALDPVGLQALVRASIESLIDDSALAITREAEASERDILGRIAATIGGPS